MERDMSGGRRVDPRLGFAIPCAGPHLLMLGACLDSIAGSTVLPARVCVSVSSVPEEMPIDLRVRYPFEVVFLRTPERMNAAENRNFAVEWLETDIVSFVDADDLVHPHRSELLLAAFDRGARAVVHDFLELREGFVDFLASDRRATPLLPGHIDTLDDDELIAPQPASGRVSYANGHVTVRADLLDLAHFPEDEDLAWCEDSLFTAALVSLGIPLDYLAGPLSIYRRWPQDENPPQAVATASPGHHGAAALAADPVPRCVFCFWAGDNPMSDQRAAALQSLRDTAGEGVEVILVTPDTLADWLVEPLHPAYPFLSLTHRADYLRAWFMHHHGGGYSDLKPGFGDWNPHFAALDAAPEAFFTGYPERGSSSIAVRPGREEIADRFAELGGMSRFIFRPGTPFTREWLDRVHAEIDHLMPALAANPGTYHPRAVLGGVHEDDTGGQFDGSRYPLEWNQLLGRILHDLMADHLGEFLLTMPHPPVAAYR